MRRTRKAAVWLTAVGLTAGAVVSVNPGAASAVPAADPNPATAASSGPVDDLPNPLEAKRRALRQAAVADVAKGTVTPVERNGSTVVKVGSSASSADPAASGKVAARDQYVELEREKTDQIFVVLAEFGDRRAANYPDQDTDPDTAGPTKFDGPLHNAIPAPDRSVDNSTIWQADYSQQHYQDLYFDTDPGAESVANYYATQSSGRYSVQGTVTNWVKVPYNEARYGRSDGFPCASNVCSNTWALIQDSVKAWVASQQAAGRTDAQIATALKAFDQWDRYDFDGDGDFNESDGYIDHFQVVHAGGDQADGDPIQGEDAIWSHRWYAYGTDQGRTGPAFNKLGGTQIGTTGLWIGDYTIQPENGGLSVFVHEYGHDLGLPDSYDTSGLGDNNNEYWTLMAQSRLNARGEPLGTRPGDLGAWQKLQLGWLDYETVRAGQTKRLTLGPSEYNSANAQAAVVVLPDKTVTSTLGAPYAGTKQWWSGRGDDYTSSLTRTVDLTGKANATMTWQSRYAIETDYDYLYVQASTDNGATWTALDGTVGGKPFPRDGSGTPALTGSSAGKWLPTSVQLPGGKPAQVRFLYRTDGATNEAGFFADAITVTSGGTTLFTDGAESGANGWTVNGFSAVAATQSAKYDHFYIAANRTYVSYDQYLETGPYNFGFPAKPDFVEHYSYQQGVLMSYWDTSQADNNTNVHPGEGLSMIIDAHPQTMYNLEGVPWRSRIQMYDAPFGKTGADSFTLHVNGKPSNVRGQDGVATFDDTRTYWYADQPNHGVKVPRTGTTMTVVQQSGASALVLFGASPNA